MKRKLGTNGIVNMHIWVLVCTVYCECGKNPATRVADNSRTNFINSLKKLVLI